jgi:hypothetical protein
MLIFSRIALFSALTATAVNALDCLTHTSCRTVICEVFDDACAENEICEQLTSDPWFNCHAENELDICETYGCGAEAECHDVMSSVFCTCDNFVVPAGESCTVHDHTCTLNCHESADCTTDGILSFCACNDGELREENQACPGWTPESPSGEDSPSDEDSPSGEDSPSDEGGDAVFDCTTCDGKACLAIDFEGDEAGCYCDELLVDPAYPCYHDEEAPLTCVDYCLESASSVCFIEHGVPACRCSDGDLVGPTESCDVDRTNSYTQSYGGCGFDVCGEGADCHYQDNEGYTCTCSTGTAEEMLIAHYKDCE